MLRTILKNAFLGLLLVLMTFSALGGIAAAVWSAVGSGSGAGGTGTTVAVTLTPGTPATSLYPGGQANVVLSVSNSNVATVRIGSLSLDTLRGTSGFSVDAQHAACGLSALTFTTQTNGTTGWTVPGKVGTVNGSLVITLTNAVAMSTSAVSACQGATFTVFLIGAP
jgi:hypothetical protein